MNQSCAVSIPARIARLAVLIFFGISGPLSAVAAPRIVEYQAPPTTMSQAPVAALKKGAELPPLELLTGANIEAESDLAYARAMETGELGPIPGIAPSPAEPPPQNRLALLGWGSLGALGALCVFFGIWYRRHRPQ